MTTATLTSQGRGSQYPRHGWIRIARGVFRHSWILPLGYAGIVLRHLASLVEHSGSLASLTPSHIFHAFALNPTTEMSPSLIFTIVLVVTVLLCALATLASQIDYEREQAWALDERAQQFVTRKLLRTYEEQVAQKNRLRLVERHFKEADEGHGSQSVDFGPPFDEQLLVPPADFLGREADESWLLSRLREPHTVVALIGTGGIGKTALAAQVVRMLIRQGTFPDGVAVTVGEGQGQSTEILQRILSRFDPSRRLPAASSLSELAIEAQRQLEGKRVLIVLDDLPSEIAASEIVQPLRAAGATVLLTARQPFPKDVVPSGNTRLLDLLDPQTAREMFLANYRLVSPSVRDLDGLEKIDQVIERLGRHTLTIKLAARYAAAGDLTPNDLLHELQDWPVYPSDYANIPNAVYLMYELAGRRLKPILHLFAAFAAFATEEFGEDAARAVARGLQLDNVDYSLAEFINLGFLDASVNEDMPPNSDRARLIMHPLLHILSRNVFDSLAEGVQLMALRAVARFYAKYVESVPLDSLSADQRNLMGALDWAIGRNDDQIIAALCSGMQYFWRDRWVTQDCLFYLPQGIVAMQNIAHQTQRREDYLRVADMRLTYGQVLRRVNRYEEAEATLKANLDARIMWGDHRKQVSALIQLGKLANARGKPKDAESYFQQALDIGRATDNRPGEGAALGSLGTMAYERGEFAMADNLLQQSLVLAQEERDRHGEAVVLSRLGDLALRRNDPETAASFFTQSLAIRQEVGDVQGEGVDRALLGRIALRRREWAEARREFEHSLALRRKAQDLRGEGVVLTALGQLELEQGQLEEAERIFNDALAIARSVGDRRNEGVELSQLGRIARRRKDWSAVLQYYVDALTIARDVENRHGEAVDLMELGRAYNELKDDRHAEEYHGRALALAEEIDEKGIQSQSLFGLGRVANRRGDLDSAEQYYTRALNIDRELRDRQGQGVDLTLLGKLALGRGKLEEAEELYNEALRIAQEEGHTPSESAIISSLGQLEQARGRMEEAERRYQQALEIDRRLNDTVAEGADLVLLAQLAQARQNDAQATALYEEALNCQRIGRDPLGVAETLGELSKLSRNRDDLEAAVRYQLLAVAGFEQLRSPRTTLALVELNGLRSVVGAERYKHILEQVVADDPEPVYDMTRENWNKAILRFMGELIRFP